MRFTVRLALLITFLFVFTWSGNQPILIGNNFPPDESVTSEDFYKLTQLFADRKVERIDSLLSRYHKYHHFHGTALVSAQGEVIYKGAVGTGDFEQNKKLTPETQFQLASGSKQFTATAAMMLKEKGELSFDEKVVDYYPNFPYERVTIQMLLNHTAGLPNYMWLIEHKWDKKRVPYNDDVIDLLAKYDKPLYFWPGSRFNYSNTNYAVLAAVVEKAADQHFGKYIEQNIFKPLGMDNSYVYSRAVDSATHGEKLEGFRRTWHGFTPIPENMHDGVVGDKGVYSTVEDLHKWDQALYNNRLISQELKEEAFTRGKVNNGMSIPYGYGFRLKKQGHEKIVYHGGRWNGFRTSFVRHIEDTTTIILFNHTNNSIKNDLVSEMEEVMDQPNQYKDTRNLVKTVVKKDVTSAIEKYYNWQQEPESVSVSASKIREAAELFETLNKPRAAARINQLYLKISNSNPENADSENDNSSSSEITS